MDIGEQERVIIVEPLEAFEHTEPDVAPAEPEREPEPEPADEPATSPRRPHSRTWVPTAS
jgi:hypothetical protein